ncbi:MAG: SOS response-associated peptidase [Chloroflexaceae bacterium]|nr:SOS response-associated peptidase [Chloroflexaceae bacterium]
MCGRFTLRTPSEVLAAQFELPNIPALNPRYNVAPTQAVAVVRQQPVGRHLDWLQWGLVPHWAKDPSIGSRMINARSETVAEKPAFRAAFKARRCLVLADGFYEWQAILGTRTKQPFYFQMEAGKPFAFAGLWEQWNGPDGLLETCTLLTTEANALVQPVHDRMPVILPPDVYSVWLAPDMHDRGALEALLVPYDPAAMQAYPVRRAVNNTRNDSPECIEPSE